MNAEPNWNIVEHGLAGASHDCVPSRVDALMADAGLPIDGPGFKGVHAVLWGTASSESTVAHVFLALWYASPRQVLDVGLDQVFALLDVVETAQDDDGQMVEAVASRVETAVGEAGRLLVRQGRDLFAFVESQRLNAGTASLDCGGMPLMAISDAIALVASEFAGIWTLRQLLATGRQNFDQ